MNIAIITARGGSKRIPNKNIRPFCGEPILCYSIRAALDSRIFDEVMVSTDSEEIARIAVSAGASVPFLRSAATSDDYATTADVLQEVLVRYAEAGKQFDELCCIYPTAPFVTAQRLREGMELLRRSGCDSVMPVVQYSYPPQRSLCVREGKVYLRYPEYARARSQDLEPVYHDCGQFYCAKASAFLREKTLFMERTAPMVLSESEVQDIDTLEDWKLAECKFQLLHPGKDGDR